MTRTAQNYSSLYYACPQIVLMHGAREQLLNNNEVSLFTFTHLYVLFTSTHLYVCLIGTVIQEENQQKQREHEQQPPQVREHNKIHDPFVYKILRHTASIKNELL